MAIHEQNYVRYDGPLRDGGSTWTIAWTGLRTSLAFTRTKLILLLLWIGGPLIAMGLVIMEYFIRGQVGQFTEPSPPSGSYVTFFLQTQAYSLAILLMASGCGVVSEDLKHQTFQLYFSKPIRRSDYAIGKLTSILLLGSLITVVPAILVGGLRIAFFMRTEFVSEVARQVAIGVGLSAFITVIMCCIVIGLSSLTERTGYVVLSWIGVLLVPLILSGIAAIATDGADIANLWSLTGNFMVFSDMILTDEAFDGPAWVAPIVLVALAAAGIAAMARRIRHLEGVA